MAPMKLELLLELAAHDAYRWSAVASENTEHRNFGRFSAETYAFEENFQLKSTIGEKKHAFG